jgi:DNA-binding response OmpR family regulator
MLRILCVDDEKGILDAVGVLCKRVEAEYDCCFNGKEALKLFKSRQYDIIIVDYMMFGMNGDEVISEIRKFNENIYIILLTGYSGIIDGISAMQELDIDCYAEKNSDLDDLMLKLLFAVKAVSKYKFPDDSSSNFSSKLKKLREQFSLDQKDIAKILNISRQAVTNYENDMNTPKIKHVIKLSEYFNVPTDYFLK